MRRSVSAVSIARSEYCSCPPRLPPPAAAHVVIASGASHRVTSPRWTSARSYAGQLPTWYFVLYFGWTLDFTSRSCAFGRHDSQGTDGRSPRGWTRAPTPRIGVGVTTGSGVVTLAFRPGPSTDGCLGPAGSRSERGVQRGKPTRVLVNKPCILKQLHAIGGDHHRSGRPWLRCVRRRAKVHSRAVGLGVSVRAVVSGAS